MYNMYYIIILYIYIIFSSYFVGLYLISPTQTFP